MYPIGLCISQQLAELSCDLCATDVTEEEYVIICVNQETLFVVGSSRGDGGGCIDIDIVLLFLLVLVQIHCLLLLAVRGQALLSLSKALPPLPVKRLLVLLTNTPLSSIYILNPPKDEWDQFCPTENNALHVEHEFASVVHSLHE